MKSLMVAAAGIAAGLMLTSTVCWAHAGHDHRAKAPRERESRVGDHRGHKAHESRAKAKSGANARSLQAPPRPAPGKPSGRIDGFASSGELAREIRDPVKK